MLGGLKKLMREVMLELGKVRRDWREGTMSGCFEKNLKFGPVDLVPIHLLVVEIDSADDGLRCEQILAFRPQPGVGGQWSVGGEPRTDRAFGDMSVEASMENPLGVSGGIAEVER